MQIDGGAEEKVRGMKNGDRGNSIQGSCVYAWVVVVASAFFVLAALTFFFMTAIPFSLHGKVTKRQVLCSSQRT